MNPDCFLHSPAIVCALGSGIDEVAPRLLVGETKGMILSEDWLPGGMARVGRVHAELPEVPAELRDFSCRFNRILLAAVAQIQSQIDAAITRFGSDRVGIVIGTSTSGIAEGEAAIASRRQTGSLPEDYRYVRQELGMPSLFLARMLGVGGPAYCVSTACTSSAKAFVSARALLRHGLCDAVVVGGADSLCRLTVNGFSALESVTASICNPMSRNRNGINIGEGAALFVMSRERSAVALLGCGESSDAHHMSAPHPEGAGAEAAMRAALQDAGLRPAEVGYLNMHATATPKNDEMESRAIARIFPHGVAVSGTKPMCGHTLGAAGAIELAFCWMALEHGRMPPHLWDGEADPGLPRLDLVDGDCRFENASRRVCMSNSFAFGGSNASLLIGDVG